MSAGGSATDQKALFGESKTGSQSTLGDVASTDFSVSGGNYKSVTGKPNLVKQINGKPVDLWNDIITKGDIRALEKVLKGAQTDSHYDMTSFIRSIEYQGFDREFYIKHALTKMSVSIFLRFAILGALRGSNFQRIIETCESMPQDMVSAFSTNGFVKTPKKRTDITILRNTASVPHWCAYWFVKAGVTRKVTKNSCPSEIQFPGAASLPMSRRIRLAHMEFCQEFSMLLPGGVFNFNIYQTAYNNPIPVNDIPNEVLALLEVSSNSESYRLLDEDTSVYTRAMIKK